MQDALMSVITENISIKPKRGRPYLLFTDANDKREWKKLNPDVRTERTLVNRVHFWHSLSALGEGLEPEFIWLADAKSDRFKHTILTELGRVDEDEEIRDLAGSICEMKLTTAEAVSFIRDCRGVSKPASAERLETVLRSGIDRWLDANGAPEQIVEVLRKLTMDVEGSTRAVPATVYQRAGS
jgi:hypothetical protein